MNGIIVAVGIFLFIVVLLFSESSNGEKYDNDKYDLENKKYCDITYDEDYEKNTEDFNEKKKIDDEFIEYMVFKDFIDKK